MKCDKGRSTLGKIVLPWDCPALCSRTFHGNPREEAQRDAAGVALCIFGNQMWNATGHNFSIHFASPVLGFSWFLQCQDSAGNWLERCEAHQQWDGRDRWFTVLQELSFCRRCRSHPHKDPAKVCWRCAISDAKLAEFGLPWFAQIDQIKQQAEVASVSVA